MEGESDCVVAFLHNRNRVSQLNGPYGANLLITTIIGNDRHVLLLRERGCCSPSTVYVHEIVGAVIVACVTKCARHSKDRPLSNNALTTTTRAFRNLGA